MDKLAKRVTSIFGRVVGGSHPPATRSNEICHIARLIASSIKETPAPPSGTLTAAQARANRNKRGKVKVKPRAPTMAETLLGEPAQQEPTVTRDKWVPPPDIYVLGTKKLISRGGKIEKFNQLCRESVYERLREGDDEQDEEENDAGNEEDVGTGLDLEGPEIAAEDGVDW